MLAIKIKPYDLKEKKLNSMVINISHGYLVLIFFFFWVYEIYIIR